MNIYIDSHDFSFETENLCRVFFVNEKLSIIKDITKDLEKPYVYTSLKDNTVTARLNIDDFDKSVSKSISDGDDAELRLEQCLYTLLQEYTDMTPPWGMLTGVRPVKLFRRIRKEKGNDFAKSYFKNELFVSDKKIDLCETVEGYERKILDLSEEKSFSLYVSIPFCPTRCSYCSFVSQSIEKTQKLINPYLELLCKELKYTAEIAKSLGLKLESVYIGGGTPTTLSDSRLTLLLDCINSEFDLSSCREFTVEAGRPDTITYEKLNAIKNGKADRISINPQTLNDKILENIGRKHTSLQTLEAFSLARKAGFEHINMDVIAGLPGESFESFKNTLDNLILLSPESITVHTLAMKRSSYMTQGGLTLYRKDAKICSDMVDYSISSLDKAGYHPYYLYRQSKMVGNLENTGFCKPHRDCYYNVYVMDETHTILSCGAGAVTKLKQFGGDYLERIFNFKYPYEYIDRFDEIIERKGRIKEFYEQYFR